MKKVIFTLAVLLLAVPAMADVDITCAPGSDPNTVVVSFAASDEAELVRAIALDIQVNDPNAWVEDVNCVNGDYYIYPGSISIDAGGNVTDYGSCAGAIDGNTMTSEMGSLYESGDPTPAQSGELFIITLGGCSNDEGGAVGVTVSQNAIRGGVVMEDPAVEPTVNLTGCTVTMGAICDTGCACLADIADTTSIGAPDGKVDTGDMAALLTALIIYGNPGDSYNITGAPNQAALLDCMDVADTTSIGAPDGRIDTGDMAAMLTHLIIFGNPASNYEAPCM